MFYSILGKEKCEDSEKISIFTDFNLNVCISYMNNLVKGYDLQKLYENIPKESETTTQFDVSDTRSLDEVVNWLIGLGYIPSFCTACYRAGRTGDRFMSLLKSGQIVNCCQPNALMTLKEYLEDYASADTKEKGEKVIQEQLEIITNPVVKEKAKEYIENIHEGKRDFRF